MSDGVGWDYEEGPNYYHVFAVGGAPPPRKIVLYFPFSKSS